MKEKIKNKKQDSSCLLENQNSIIKRNWLSLLVIIGVILSIYVQSVEFDLIYFDDDVILIENKSFFTTDFSIKKAFTTDAFLTKEGYFYRPLQNLSFAVNAYFAGSINPQSFHFTNLVLFILIGISLYFFLLKFKITSRFAFLGTIIFVVHPLNVWSVVWIPSRGDLLLTLFTLLSFICFINFLTTNKYKDLFFTLLCFSLALFSKETAALIPFLFLFYWGYIVYGEAGNKVKITYKHFILAGLMFCIGILWLYLRYHATTYFDKMISWQDFVIHLQNIPVALSQIVVPYEMSPFPAFSFIKIILGCLIFVALIFILLKKTKNSRIEKLLLLSWFFLFLFPVFFIKLPNVDYLEHRYLLPQIGIIMLIILFAQDMDFSLSKNASLKQKSLSRFIRIGLYILIIIFCITSFVKVRTLQNQSTVVKAVEKYKGLGIIPYTNRGIYYSDREKYETAAKYYDKVLQLDPKNLVSLINLANIKAIYKDYENAIALFTTYISINNRNEGAYFNRAMAKKDLGDFEGALLDLDSAIMITNDNPLIYNTRGVLKMRLGFLNGALPDFDEAIKLSDSTYSDPIKNKAFVISQLENH